MNRTGTYVAFDGQGSTDPTESDIHYFNLLKAWNKSGSIDFRFTNSHEKTYQVRDSSSKATLFAKYFQVVWHIMISKRVCSPIVITSKI